MGRLCAVLNVLGPRAAIHLPAHGHTAINGRPQSPVANAQRPTAGTPHSHAANPTNQRYATERIHSNNTNNDDNVSNDNNDNDNYSNVKDGGGDRRQLRCTAAVDTTTTTETTHQRPRPPTYERHQQTNDQQRTNEQSINVRSFVCSFVGSFVPLLEMSVNPFVTVVYTMLSFSFLLQCSSFVGELVGWLVGWWWLVW